MKVAEKIREQFIGTGSYKDILQILEEWKTKYLESNPPLYDNYESNIEKTKV